MSTAKAIRSVEGRGIAVRGDDIDTDRIIPARFLRCVTFDGLGEHAFEDDREGWTGAGVHPFDRPEFAGAGILVVNANFGCGSSREHAPQSLQRWGIRGIIGESFAEIFFGNCVALGLPCVTMAADRVEALQERIESDPTLDLQIDVEARVVDCGGESLPAGIPDGARQAFLSGCWDSTAMLLGGIDKVETVARALPYVTHWPFPGSVAAP